MKSPLRRRISPSTPFILEYTNFDGSKVSESFKLSYNFKSMSLVEEQLGISMLTSVGEIIDNPTARNASVLLWGAVQEYQPEYSTEEGLEVICQNLTVATVRKAMSACFDAYVLQLPEEQQERVRKIKAAREAGEEVAAPLVESQTVAS